jgi:hypothetical protein
MNWPRKTTTASGVILPKYLEYLRDGSDERAPQVLQGLLALGAALNFRKRKPRTT